MFRTDETGITRCDTDEIGSYQTPAGAYVIVTEQLVYLTPACLLADSELHIHWSCSGCETSSNTVAPGSNSGAAVRQMRNAALGHADGCRL